MNQREVEALLTLSSPDASPLFVSVAGSIVDLIRENDSLDKENCFLRRRISDEEKRTDA